MNIGATFRGSVAANALLGNELRRMGKRWQTYSARMTPLYFMLGIGAVMLAMSAIMRSSVGSLLRMIATVEVPEFANASAFIGFAILFIGACMGTPVLSASSFTQEKNDRVLAILLMADLDGWGLIRAKFITLWLQMLATQLTALPALVLGAYLGAFTPAETAGTASVIFAGGTLACGVGMCASLYFDRSSLAGGVTILALVFVYFIAVAILKLLPNTGFGFYDFMVWSYPAVAAPVALAPLPAVLMLARRLLYSRAYQSAGVKRTSSRTLRRRRRYGNQRALMALAASCLRGAGFAGGVRFFRWLSYIGVLMVSLVPFLGWLFIIVLVFREIILSMERLRREGVLDDLVLVPHGNGALGFAMWMGQLRLAAPFGIITAIGVLAPRSLFEIHASFVAIGLPLVLVHFLAATAVACFFGTFNVRIGGIGGYLYAAYWTLTCIVPAVLLGREALDALDSILFGAGQDAPWNLMWYLGGWTRTFAYLAINVVPTAALCAWAIRAFGNRLRNDVVLTALRAKER